MAVKEVFALVVQADVAGGAAKIKEFAAGAKKDIDSTSESTAAMAANLQRAGVAMTAAGAAGLAALTGLAMSARSAASETLTVQRTMGGTAETASTWRFIAQQTGTSVDSLSTAVVRLSKAAASDAGAKKLAAYGIAARDADGQIRPLNELLVDVAAATKNLSSAGERNDFVTSIFGRGGTSMLPLLNRGAEGLGELTTKAAEFGAVLSDDTLEASKKFTKAQRDMAAATDALKVSVGSEVLPVIASINTQVAEMTTKVTKVFAALPDGVKSTVVATAMAGSGLMSVAGPVLTLGAAATITAQGVGQLTSKFGGLTTMAKGAAGPLAIATVAFVALTSAVAAADAQTEQYYSTLAVGQSTILAAFDTTQPQRFAELVAKIRADIVGDDIGPANWMERFDSWAPGDWSKFSLGRIADDDEKRVKRFNASLANLQATMESLSPAQFEQTIKVYSDELDALERNGGSSAKNVDVYRQAIDGVVGAYETYQSTQRAAAAATDETAGAVDQATTAADRYAAAVKAATPEVVTLADAMRGLADGVDPGELTVWAQSLNAALDPVFGLADANKRLEDAQKRVVEATRRDSTAILNAYERLADAKANLDRVLKGDGDGLTQVSPEAQIADARARVMRANATLVNDPTNAKAQTDRDLALADEQRAIQRRQDMLRNAQQKEREIADAQRQVRDAEKAVTEARTTQQQTLTQAQDDLDRGRIALVGSLAAVAGAVESGVLSQEELNRQLQVLADQGILPQDTVDRLTARTDEAVNAAAVFAAGVGNAAAELEKQRTYNGWAIINDMFAGLRPGASTAGSRNLMSVDARARAAGISTASSSTPSKRTSNPATGMVFDEYGFPVPTASRGAGGPVSAGRLYRVNDPGHEIFVPSTDGTILSSGRAGGMTGAQNPSGDNISITINGGGGRPKETATEVLRQWRRRRFLGVGR